MYSTISHICAEKVYDEMCPMARMSEDLTGQLISCRLGDSGGSGLSLVCTCMCSDTQKFIVIPNSCTARWD